jgi:GT2 family glycosyltransferase
MSAAKNRNFALSWASSDIIIFLDDDITGFYKGWLTDLIEPMSDPNIMVLGARLTNPEGKSQMGANSSAEPVYPANDNRVTTAVIAIRKNDIRFDENFIGSGYEDTDYCQQIKEKHGLSKIWINNNCKLIHINEMKNQGGEYWEHNHAYYCQKWPNDYAVKNQKDWTK